jgi:hypothetical protein
METMAARDYFKIVDQANDDYKKYKIKSMPLNERDIFIADRVKELKLNSTEELLCYTSHLLIPNDEEFIRLYKENGKIANVVAKILNVPLDIVVARVTEISKYQTAKTREERNSSNYLNQEDLVEKETSEAISKIEKLFSESSKVDSLNDELHSLRKENAELKEKLVEYQNMKELIHEQEAQILALIKYKNAYEKLIGSLKRENVEENGNFTR